MPAILMTLYAAATYALFLATFMYMVGFVGNLPLPKTVDAGAPGPLGMSIVVDILLIALFGIQHSVMARPSFKRWWTRFVPQPIERSTFVLATSVVLALMFWQWRPLASPDIWAVRQRVGALALEVLFWVGWGVLLVSTYLIDHFELFGLRQACARLMGRDLPLQSFRTPLLYRHVRHPIYLGFLIAFWATPRMTAGHLLFAAGCSVYILIGIYFEERDLLVHFGDRYRQYREQVGMLFPHLPRRVRHGSLDD